MSSLTGWERIVAAPGSSLPCQRSLHAGAVWRNFLIVFGGYDGHRRVNDLYSFNFKTSVWEILPSLNAPSARDRHVAVVFENNLYVFGGFDGLARVNDLYAYDLEQNEWRSVPVSRGTPPSPRHSHAAVVYGDSMFVFGGYDGSYRNDFHEFNFTNRTWNLVHAGGEPPRSRYRGTCVVSGDSMILHGGHDGNRHLQDTHVFDFVNLMWSTLITEGPIPSPRDSHIAVIYDKSMFLYGGSTGSAMGDFHELKLEFRRVWTPVFTYRSYKSGLSNVTPAQSRSSSGTSSAGSSNSAAASSSWLPRSGANGIASDGSDSIPPQLSGLNIRSVSPTATPMSSSAQQRRSPRSLQLSLMPPPPATDAPSFGFPPPAGSSSNNNNGSTTSNVHATTTATTTTTAVATATATAVEGSSSGVRFENDVSPGVRFCHIGVVHENCLYIFGGYDGSHRLNDFLRYRFDQNEPEIVAAPSTLISDLRQYVNNDIMSDVQFVVEGIPVHAHKILCLRCPYFHNMLTGEYMESRASEIVIQDVRYATFLMLMEYIYTDRVDIGVDNAMDLFQVADRFGIDRLKKLCEQEMLNAISTETASQILFTADQYNADNLRERCICFILVNFDQVSRTAGFEEMGRTNVELVFEILKRR